VRIIDKIPTKMVEATDYEQWVKLLLDAGDFCQVSMSTSHHKCFVSWLRKHKPEYKLITRQLSGEYHLYHENPLPYCITLVAR
jgi:hypothetical protein